ncbi:dienelactone hydrolase [Vibrio breoganii]|uniref:Dienelactone hydrolase n=1 Tax=Vibrio breoganii TaxID=553239 RepID=A0AAN0XY67_9VIBR|nr:dienelactone hydrolase family protein [Vibrio breoganii]ANO34800.1 dienelactone hydrolase [Vibrio breoganii]MDN3715776.1 dienelactone hydrolase family protein [Vibrio breoganii]PMG77670.1 dienelactone hydrolase [Vibrio breoganii]PMO36034.1 dienelactone hydrolase [Vibrio breoganii]PMO56482.1 dienelactone hydrolase [Vibrio breoganii]
MRHFLTAALILGSVNAVAGEDIVYEVDGKAYQGYWSKVSDSAPLVLLVHDWDGLTDYEIKRAEMLNEQGYNVFAADLFGQGVRPTEVKDKKQHTGELYKDRAKLQKLMAESQRKGEMLNGGGDNTVVMGYCFGGAAVLEAARAGADAKAFVTFHGGLTTPKGQSYKMTKAPVVVFHGTADTAITMKDFAMLADELEKTGIKHEMVSYGGAPHAFTVFGSERYREDADMKSWTRFNEVLVEVTK